MPYKKYLKTDDLPNYDKAIIDILTQGRKTQPEIQELISKKPYKLDLTRMGLWKILNKLEEKGEIEKSLSNNALVYQVSPKSKIRAEFDGILFQEIFKNKMFKHRNALLGEFYSANQKKDGMVALMQLFGFFVLGSFLASNMTEKSQRRTWLRAALDLERAISMSTLFEDLLSDEKTLKKMVSMLRKYYKKNFKVLANSFIEAKKSKEKFDKLDKSGFDKGYKWFIDEVNKIGLPKNQLIKNNIKT